MFKPKRINYTLLNDILKPSDNPKNYFYRINRNIRIGRPNVIVIDGVSQSGKSVFAKAIAGFYDREYVTCFTTEDILGYLQKCSDFFYSGEFDKIKGKWIFFDEPQLEISKQEFWTERNRIIQAITGSFGFLKNNLIMALPNIRGLSDIVLTNITLRGSTNIYEGRNKEIVRKVYFKKVIWSDYRKRFIWITFQRHTIPYIEPDLIYELQAKPDNFFKTHLPRWQQKIGIYKENKDWEIGKPINKLDEETHIWRT